MIDTNIVAFCSKWFTQNKGGHMIIPISDYWTDEQIAEVIQRIIEEEEEEEK